MESEQRVNIKFLVKLGKNGSEIHDMLQTVYGDSSLCRAAVFNWVKRFKEGREDVGDDARQGRPSTSRVDQNLARVPELVLADRHITQRMIANTLNNSKGSVQSILIEDLGMRKADV